MLLSKMNTENISELDDFGLKWMKWMKKSVIGRIFLFACQLRTGYSTHKRSVELYVSYH